MKTFKVRVVKAKYHTYWYVDKIDRVFDVRNYHGDYVCVGADIDGHKAENRIIDKSDCVIVEDSMEYTVNGVTYRQLKDITVKALVLAGADDEYVEYFGMDYNITEQIWLRIAIDFSSRWPERLQWLVDQGFVEVVEEALKACPFCGGEAHWQTEKRDWIACSDCKIETNVMDSTQEAISLWNKRV